MRLLANENIPAVLVDALRAAEHDVAWVRSDSPGAEDPDILARAEREGRTLLTFDRDFGELAFRKGLPATCGVILLRFPKLPPQSLAGAVEPILSGRTDWVGHFSVIEPGQIRMTVLPSEEA